MRPGVIRRTGAHAALARHIVEMQPALRPGHDALGAQHGAVFAGIQRGKGVVQLGLSIHARRLAAETLEHVIRVMVALMAMMMPAAAGIAVLVVAPVFVLMLMFMPVPACLAGAALAVAVPVFVLMGHLLGQLCHQGAAALHRVQKLRAGELVPRRGDNGRLGVLFAQQCHGGGQLFFADVLRAAEDDGAGVLNLVIVKFAEVLHIQLYLARVGHGDEAGQLCVCMQGLHGGNHIRKLAHA